jgi:predicted nucleic acid-binding protein
LITADTSVAIAAALPWHEAHAAARSALPRKRTPLIAQVAVETYSVLTRLPPLQRVPAAVARDYLGQAFLLPPVALPPESYEQLIDVLVAEEITGGAVYDAIVAATALEVGATLLTLDRRAISTYRRLGTDYQLVQSDRGRSQGPLRRRDE